MNPFPLTILLAISLLNAVAFAEKPNVVVIFDGDLGYGDTGCYGATKIKTPNIDRLAEAGRRFTDAHSVSAVCTPSRYNLITGEYAFRGSHWSPVFLKIGLLIDPNQTTVADVMKRAGHKTSIIGKWHLGFGEETPNWNGELKPGPRFQGTSECGRYGDFVHELDWIVGEVMNTLEEQGLTDNTLVVFTSDNGPWIEPTHASRGVEADGKPFIPLDHSESALPLRGWKMSAWDGGSRVPFIAHWPSMIPASAKSDELLSTMDFPPTFASLAGAELPKWKIDGLNATNFLLGKSESPRDDFFHYTG